MQSSNLKTLTRLYIEQQTVQVTSSLDFHGHMLKKKTFSGGDEVMKGILDAQSIQKP